MVACVSRASGLLSIGQWPNLIYGHGRRSVDQHSNDTEPGQDQCAVPRIIPSEATYPIRQNACCNNDRYGEESGANPLHGNEYKKIVRPHRTTLARAASVGGLSRNLNPPPLLCYPPRAENRHGRIGKPGRFLGTTGIAIRRLAAWTHGRTGDEVCHAAGGS